MTYARIWLGVVSLLLSVGVLAETSSVQTQLIQRPSELQLKIEFPDVSFNREADGVVPEIKGLALGIEAGMPRVPLYHVNVALPAGKRLAGVKAERGAVTISEDKKVAQSRGMAPLSWLHNPPARVAVAAPEIPAVYPDQWESTSVQVKHGVQVVSVIVHPVQVEAQSGRVSFSREASVSLQLEEETGPVRPLTVDQLHSVEPLVINPQSLRGWPLRQAGYDYLIIATSLVADYHGDNNLQTLQDSLANRNLKAKVVRLADALKAEGKDDATKMRNFIKREYERSAIRYVLLAGKSKTSGGGETIPFRKLWSKIRVYLNATWSDHTEEIAGDIYFSNLDGTFDGNGNGIYGEVDDGENGKDVDFLSEVTVGRAALETTAEVSNFVKKSVWAAEHTLPHTTLLAGEDLFPELNLSGMDYLTQLIGGSDDHGFTTKGLGSDWKVDELDDRKGNWSGSQALSMINTGNYSMLNHLGHSNESYNLKLSSMFGMPKFTNPNPLFYYSQGCLAGRFFVGSIVDKLVRHSNAAFAAMGNSAYGLAPEDPDPASTKTPGTSHMVHRMFLHAMVTGMAKTFGAAHVASKEQHLKYINQQEMRWVNWTANYFGDPSIGVPF